MYVFQALSYYCSVELLKMSLWTVSLSCNVHKYVHNTFDKSCSSQVMYNKLETIDNNEILLPLLARYHNEF